MSNAIVANLTSNSLILPPMMNWKNMYGGPEATAYFVRETRKATWFTQCPVTLTRCNGVAEFGSEWAFPFLEPVITYWEHGYTLSHQKLL